MQTILQSDKKKLGTTTFIYSPWKSRCVTGYNISIPDYLSEILKCNIFKYLKVFVGKKCLPVIQTQKICNTQTTRNIKKYQTSG